MIGQDFKSNSFFTRFYLLFPKTRWKSAPCASVAPLITKTANQVFAFISFKIQFLVLKKLKIVTYKMVIFDHSYMHHNPCFNLFIFYNYSFDNQGSKTNKIDIFLRFNILSLRVYIYIYITIALCIHIYIIYIHMYYIYSHIYKQINEQMH